MPTPAQQQEYYRLSDILITIVRNHLREVPKGAVSLALTNDGHPVTVEAYDRLGKVIGIIPNDSTSPAFRAELETAFGSVKLPDENLIVFVPY
jgi:hypothetical protein